MSDSAEFENESNRFEESTDLQYGAVEEEITEDDVLPFNSCRAVVWDHDGRYYAFGMPTRVGMDFSIYFDELEYRSDTLWFYRTTDEGREVSGTLDWSPIDAGAYYGLVGEWFLEQLDLEEYRTDVDCPKCGSTVLAFQTYSGCYNPDCDFFVEGGPEDAV